MKFVLLSFVVLASTGIIWGYMSSESKSVVKSVVKKNVIPVLMALIFVICALIFSSNTITKVF